ncbi:MAG: hypothetical protein RIS60_71, partial [Pseudomonadota bacterium]
MKNDLQTESLRQLLIAQKTQLLEMFKLARSTHSKKFARSTHS